MMYTTFNIPVWYDLWRINDEGWGIRVNAYQFQFAGKIIAGSGALERLAEHAAVLPPARKALVLSQPSMVKAGHVDTVVRQLRQLGVESVCSLGIKPEPTILIPTTLWLWPATTIRAMLRLR